jgi:hypothetical protein
MHDRDAPPAPERAAASPGPSSRPSLAEFEADAAIASLVLPGVMHKIRNLLFAMAGSLDLLEGAGPPGAAESLRMARGSLADLRAWLDICGGRRGGDAGQRWLESGSVSIGRLGECLGFLLAERQLGFELAVEPSLPGLAVAPMALFRWTAVALRRVLAAVPDGLQGSLVADAAADAPGSVRIQLQHRAAPGFLPLVSELHPFEPDLLALALRDGIGLDVTARPGPAVTLYVPLRSEIDAPALKSAPPVAQPMARPAARPGGRARRKRSPSS